MRHSHLRGLRTPILIVSMLMAMIWPSTQANSQTGSAISPDTRSGYAKSNQSKLFYHVGKWYAIAFYDSLKKWYLWQYSGGVWTKSKLVDDKSTVRKFDLVMNSTTGKLYLMGSHHTASKFWRYTYSGGIWTKDTGFDVDPAFVNTDQVNPISLVQAKNGDLWIFRIESNKLQAKRSTDGGATWSAVIDLKSGLTAATGATDAVIFSSGGNDYVGVAYGEANTTGSKYGFLIHRDGDPDGTWTEESASLTFFGSERADNQICAAADNSDNVYVFTQNANVSGSDPYNTLYKRTSAGVWSKYVVNSATSGINWKSPALVAEVSNNKLFLMGVNTSTQFVEYKSCLIGLESTLSGAAVAELISSPGSAFNDVSAPAPYITSTSSLVVCADNTTNGDIWYNLLNLVPVTVGSVTVASNEVNANAAYTIPLTLANNGALGAGVGTISFRFPDNTFVPAAMTASEVIVNGTPATTVITNSATRQVTVTTPVNLMDNQSFPVVFNAGAGLLNPSLVGNYTLEAWTSAQLNPGTSPAYALTPATTTVTPATVTMSTTEPDSCTNYTIAFNLGAQGRMVSGTSTFTVTFDTATTITNGALTGVMVNGVNATATGDNTTKTVDITLPATVTLNNNAAVALSLPSSVICNPALVGSYALTVATSVETTAVASNPYRIIERVTIGPITVVPDQTNANASYTILLTLASTGALTAGVDMLSFRFPDGTTVPNPITANQITVNGTPATTVVSNSTTREVHVTTPVNLANGQNFSVVFNTGAGLINPPNPGDYTLQAWTSVQPIPGTSPIYTLISGTGSPISTDTQSGYRRSNQSKVFYYDSQWWALAFNGLDNYWYLWRYNGSAWSQVVSVRKGLAFHWDAVLNANTGKLYLFGSHKSSPYFYRYTYSGGNWKKDSGFPVQLIDFPNIDTGNPVSLVQAKNGDLWIFRIDSNLLQAKRSSDGGQTWSAVINLKTGLTTANGLTDAVAFSSGSDNYIGVAYGETDAPGSKFGFLLHRDGDPDNTWTDESSLLTSFGGERGFNNLCMTTDANNNVYLLTRNMGVTGSNPRNTLYKRTSGGVWDKYKVNTSSAWKTPAIAIDSTNNRIYVMGVNASTQASEYKTCLIGGESTLEGATASELFVAPGAAFDDLSVPAANINAVMGLMVCGDNTSTSDIWYRHFVIGGGTPVTVGPVTVVSNEVNANATYTIPLTLSSTGGLNAGVGVINFRFPDNTYVPNTMPASAVRVDGTPATSIVANSTSRQVSVTTPVNLPNNYSFPVVFDSTAGAGLLNPTTVGTNYQLTVWTSAQPTQVNSPFYSLVQATTKVMPATVTPFPTDPDSMANYTLNFRLGAHGRLLSGISTFTVKFGAATTVTPGTITGAKVNDVNTTATGNDVLRMITVTLPSAVSLTNNAFVTLFLPRAAIHNPLLAGSYTLMVATSVETTMVASNPYEIKPSTNIGAPIPGTNKVFDRNNQSKMFYHGGNWWVTAQSKIDFKWYLWKYDGVTWTQSTRVHDKAKSRPTCNLDASNNKVYILLPGSSTTYITRLSYSGGIWTVDGGYPYTIPDFEQEGDRGIDLVRAQSGDFWVFMISDSTLLAKRSSNQGQTWSGIITVKDNLHNHDGLTDAVAFSYGGKNYVGVGYAENSVAGSVYGFLRHKDSDPDGTWTDETGAIPQFSGTTSDDHLSMAVVDDEVLMVIKTNGGGPSTANIGLLHRATDGSWNQYPILLSTGWTRPTLTIDDTNNRLYVIGTREGPVKVGEMKHVAVGDYSSLVSAPVDTIFMNENDSFFNTSVAAHHVNGTMNLLVCNGNETRDELWYNLVLLGGGSIQQRGEEPITEAVKEKEDFEGVQVYPNPFNPNTFFRFKVKEKAAVKLQIFNLTGQLVRTLVDDDLAPGVYQRRWNGRSKEGRPAASGLYLYRLQIDRKVMTGRIQLLK